MGRNTEILRIILKLWHGWCSGLTRFWHLMPVITTSVPKRMYESVYLSFSHWTQKQCFSFEIFTLLHEVGTPLAPLPQVRPWEVVNYVRVPQNRIPSRYPHPFIFTLRDAKGYAV